MKKKYFFIILALTIILLYISNISQIPKKIVLLQGEEIKIKKLYGIQLSYTSDSKEVWKNQITENKKVDVKLLGNIKVKEVSVTKSKSNTNRKPNWTKIIYKWSFSNRTDRNSNKRWRN